MLRAVIVSPDTEMASRLEELISRSSQVALIKATDRYLLGHDLERFLRANAPQVVFLSVQQLERAIEAYHTMEQVIPGIQVVAIDRGCNPSVLLDLMRVGIRELLAYPFDSAGFAAAIDRLEEILRRKPARIDICDNVFSFLPSKAGAGTSTIALNTAVALANMANNKTLLMDLDLNSGLLGFMLRLDASYTIYEAAENAGKLDEHLWPQLVNSVGQLDVLPAGRLDPQTRIDPMQIRYLIGFARRFYRAICIDLSGNMEKYSLEVMHESKRIFVVVTPEIPTLHLARQKLRLIQDLDLGSRVSVLLNRAQKRGMIPTPQIEELLGFEVCQEFPNDYRGVHEAVTNGRGVKPDSELGKGFVSLAQTLMEQPEARLPKANKRRFLEYFSVLPRPYRVPAK